MSKKSTTNGGEASVKKCRRALSPESRENQMIALAVDLAEEQLRNGTASSQVITHYLKLGTTKMQQEKKLLEQQTELAKAKVDSLKSASNMEKLYEDAIQAMREYSGHGDDEDYV